MIHPWAEPDPSEPLQRRVRRWKIDRYLQGLHCTLWPGVGFDVTDDDERADAVTFLEDMLDSLGSL